MDPCPCCYYTTALKDDDDERLCGWRWSSSPHPQIPGWAEGWVWWHGDAPHVPYQWRRTSSGPPPFNEQWGPHGLDGAGNLAIGAGGPQVQGAGEGPRWVAIVIPDAEDAPGPHGWLANAEPQVGRGPQGAVEAPRDVPPSQEEMDMVPLVGPHEVNLIGMAYNDQ